MNPTSHPQLVILSPKQLSSQLGLSLVTIWRMRRDKELPEPIRLSPGRVGRRSSDIENWLAHQQQHSRPMTRGRRKQADSK